MRRDLERIAERATLTGAQLGFEDAGTVAGYVRALGGIARARNKAGNLKGKSFDELLREAADIPEVRAALLAAGES